MNTYSKAPKSRRGAQDTSNKTALVLGIALALTGGVAHAAQSGALCTPITNTGNNNFTMLGKAGGITGGTNDVSFTWDGTFFDSSNDYTGSSSVSNATIASSTPFFSYPWVAHHVQVFKPGDYAFDTTLGGGNAETGTMNLHVGTNQIGMHMLFDWGGTSPTACGKANCNIDVVLALDKSATFGSSTATPPAACGAGTNCLWVGTGYLGGNSTNAPVGNQVWMLASVDQTGTYSDGVPGTPMAAGGPFGGFHANFNFRGTLSKLNGLEDGTCGSALDQQPPPFNFDPPVTNAALSTEFTSPMITVTGLGATQAVPNPAQTAPISITGGSYSINSGTYVTTAGTVSNNDTVRVKAVSGATLGVTVTATLNIGGITGSFVVSTPDAPVQVYSNFTMIGTAGGIAGGANDVQVGGWNFSTTNNTSNFGTIFAMTLTSNTAFDGYFWKAHDIRVFEPGTYTFKTACTIAELHASGGQTCANPGDALHLPLNMTVNTGQLGAHMLFDWGSAAATSCGLANCDIDVAIVWDKNKKFGPSNMYTTGGGCSATIWDLSSTDPDNDGKSGIPMKDGPFKGFNANFNLKLGGPFPGCSSVPPPNQVPDTGVSKGVGCSLSTTPVNSLERGDWWLLLGFVAWMGGLVVKRKRAQ